MYYVITNDNNGLTAVFSAPSEKKAFKTAWKTICSIGGKERLKDCMSISGNPKYFHNPRPDLPLFVFKEPKYKNSLKPFLNT